MTSDDSAERGFDSHGATDRPLLTDSEAQHRLHRTHDVVGRKWSLPIVYHLLVDGPLRFSELADRIDGISSKILSDNLEHLQEHDIARRAVVEETNRVEYALTPHGRNLEPVVMELLEWGASAEAEQAPR